jgi:hypothetical protein
MNKINPLDICKDCPYHLKDFDTKEYPFDIGLRLNKGIKEEVIEYHYCSENNTPSTCMRDKNNFDPLIEDLEWEKEEREKEEKRANKLINLFTLGIIILAIIIIRYLIKGI